MATDPTYFLRMHRMNTGTYRFMVTEGEAGEQDKFVYLTRRNTIKAALLILWKALRCK